eukprot:15482079-Alexandrium_andersonii.AAC.1
MVGKYFVGCRAFRSENMRTCLRRSKLELCGPRKGLETDPRSSGGVDSVSLFAHTPSLVMKRPAGAPEAHLG